MQDVSRLHTQGAGTVPEGGTATPEGGLRALRALGEAEAPEGTALREKPGRNTGWKAKPRAGGFLISIPVGLFLAAWLAAS